MQIFDLINSRSPRKIESPKTAKPGSSWIFCYPRILETLANRREIVWKTTSCFHLIKVLRKPLFVSRKIHHRSSGDEGLFQHWNIWLTKFRFLTRSQGTFNQQNRTPFWGNRLSSVEASLRWLYRAKEENYFKKTYPVTFLSFGNWNSWLKRISHLDANSNHILPEKTRLRSGKKKRFS